MAWIVPTPDDSGTSPTQPVAGMGLAAVLPEKIQVAFRTRRCTGNPQDTIPIWWTETIDLDDGNPCSPTGSITGSPGQEVFKDDALALFNVGGMSPTNQTALHALAKKMAGDLTCWRTLSFDTVFNGVIAPVPDGAIDLIEWSVDDSDQTTRIQSQPLSGEPEQYNHNDPANAGCVDTGTAVVTQEPCVSVYVPVNVYTHDHASTGTPNCSGTITKFYRSKICLEDGRLYEKYVKEDDVVCRPECIVGYVNLNECSGASGFPPRPTSFGGDIISVTIDDGGSFSSLMTFIGGCFPGPPIRFCGTWAHQCLPGFGTYNVTIVTTTGTKTASCTFTSSNQVCGPICVDEPCKITVNYTVQDCIGNPYGPCSSPGGLPLSYLGVGGVTVTQDTGGATDSCITNDNGQCSITFVPPLTDPVGTKYYYTTAANADSCVKAWPTGSITNNYVTKSVCSDQTFNVGIQPDLDPACCCACCGRGYPSVLTITDALYGACPITCIAPGIWRGSKAGAYPGFCAGDGSPPHLGHVGFPYNSPGCPATSVNITYTFTCSCFNVVTGARSSDNLLITWGTYTFKFKYFNGFVDVGDNTCCPGPLEPCLSCQLPVHDIPASVSATGAGDLLVCTHPINLSFSVAGSGCSDCNSSFGPPPATYNSIYPPDSLVLITITE